jgi:hypothetical protein
MPFESEPREMIVDHTLLYYREAGGPRSVCQARVWSRMSEPLIVLLSDLPQNTGPTVTNAIEAVARRLWQFLERPVCAYVLFQHHPGPPEDFEHVLFKQEESRFSEPQWTPVPFHITGHRSKATWARH